MSSSSCDGAPSAALVAPMRHLATILVDTARHAIAAFGSYLPVEDPFIAIAFRLGLQYEAVENLKIRAGFAYDNTPIPEKTLSPSLPGNDRAIVSLGLGYSIAGVRADVGYQFVNALEREVVDTNNLPGIYKTKAHVIGINLGYGY